MAESKAKKQTRVQRAKEAAEHTPYPPIVVPSVMRPFQGFVDFVRQQGVIGLAVGLVLGTAAKEVVDNIVKSFIEPLLSILVPKADNLADASFYFAGSTFRWGSFVSAVIRFLAVAGVIYFIVHGLKLDKIDKKKEA